MIASIVKIISSRIEATRRRFKVLVNGAKDVQDVYQSSVFGEDSSVPKGHKGIYLPTGQKGKSVLVGVININQIESLSSGEKSIYSTNDEGDSLQAIITLRNDGQLELNGSGDFAVKHTPLSEEMLNLQIAINAELALIATGIGAAGGTYVPGVIQIDISGAKVDTVKLP